MMYFLLLENFTHKYNKFTLKRKYIIINLHFIRKLLCYDANFIRYFQIYRLMGLIIKFNKTTAGAAKGCNADQKVKQRALQGKDK